MEKRKENGREIWVGQNRLYLGDDNILYVTVVGEWDEKTATEISEADSKLRNMIEGTMDVLINLNKAGKQTSGARKIVKELGEHEKTGKVALFGLHPVAKILASFVMGITRKKDMRFFKTEEEALAWLKE